MEDSGIAIFDAGAISTWNRFQFAASGVPPMAKCFLKDTMGLAGMEVSLNALGPGERMPFTHRHRENEELYLFLAGAGEFQADGKTLQIREGTCIRCAPAVARSWSNTGDAEMHFIVIQAPCVPIETSAIHDGELVQDKEKG